jgi:uncharacterized protein (TIGR03437 family)
LISFLLPALASVSYTYDAAGRLSKVDYGNGTVITYSYDKAGNLLSRQVQNSGPVITSVNTSGAGPVIAQNTWIEIKGTALVPANTPAAGMIWSNEPSFAAGNLPTQLGGVSVKVNGQPAFVYFYCSVATSQICTSDQINVLTPLDSTVGQVSVVVTNNGSSSKTFMVAMKSVSPSFLLFSVKGYVVATHTDYSLLGPASLFAGLSTPAKTGETIVLYGVGWGLPATPLTNGSSSQLGSLAALPVCTIGGSAAPVSVAALINPGLYQFNITVPNAAASGDNGIVCTYAGASTPATDLIAVQ